MVREMTSRIIFFLGLSSLSLGLILNDDLAFFSLHCDSVWMSRQLVIEEGKRWPSFCTYLLCWYTMAKEAWPSFCAHFLFDMPWQRMHGYTAASLTGNTCMGQCSFFTSYYWAASIWPGAVWFYNRKAWNKLYPKPPLPSLSLASRPSN